MTISSCTRAAPIRTSSPDPGRPLRGGAASPGPARPPAPPAETELAAGCDMACRGCAGLLLLLGLLQLLGRAAACPCQDPRLCQPIAGTGNFEVFVFDVGKEAWKSYDWSKITTVAAFGKYDPELLCFAHSKGARVVLKGYEEYITMGIDPKKLVMGVPWYGYDYVCLNLSEDHVCSLSKVPFRGAPCSDAAGRQVPYGAIMKQVNSSISGALWDEVQNSPFYEYKDSLGHFHQVWYDDPHSISLKAAYVKNRGLRGIGMWNGNSLDYSREAVAEKQTEAMWQALTP
uniref:Chitobiase n=1 Tax=Meleagris gallopavo TaxID=9103 RepID=A0A803XZW6_MELGA